MTRPIHWILCSHLLLALALAASLASCDDDANDVDTVTIQLVDSGDDSPVVDAEVGLFDLVEWKMVRNQPVDAQGEARLRPPVAGSYVPVIQARGRQVFTLPQSRIDVGNDGRQLQLTIPLRPARELTDFGVRLAGRVIDSTTGRPVAYAQVEMTSAELQDPNFSELRGNRSASEVVTDTDGDFVIDRVPMVQIIGQTDLFTTSLRVRAQGYRSAFQLGWAQSDVPAQITIALEPGQDDGQITGRVVDLDGQPLTGVSVRTEWRAGSGALFRRTSPTQWWIDAANSPDNLALPSLGRSGADGRFVLSRVPRGRLHVRAAVDEGDGFWSDNGRNVELADTVTTVDVGDLLAMPALELVRPESGATVDSTVILQWNPYPQAQRYFVSILRGDGAFANARSDSIAVSLSTSGDFLQSDRWYSWRVFALDASDAILSASSRAWLLRVE